MKKPHVLIFIDWYLPGYKAGGPIRSVANLVQALHDSYDFSIVTTDRDLGDAEPYPDLETDVWIEEADCKVWYCSPERRSYRHIRSLVFNTEFDVLYVQSMFSLRFSLFPLFTARALRPEAKLVLAPRGMLHPGAMGLKSRKKKFYLRLFKLLGLHKSVIFQATDAQESADIQQWFGEVEQEQAGNLPLTALPDPVKIPKTPGTLKLVFFSRLTIKKGLHLAIEALQKQTAAIELDLYGVQDEPAYWERCEALIKGLPEHIQVNYRGTVAPSETLATLQNYHALIMPTRGENFGHAIFEALAAGRPVLISDQSPWRDLESQQAGWDLPLQNEAQFARVVTELAAMEAGEWWKWAQGAEQLARQYLEGLDPEGMYQVLFSPPKEA